MTATRAAIETILVTRCGGLMPLVGMDVSFVGTNADLNDPIGYALRQLGYSVQDMTHVVDSDTAALESDDINAFLAAAELRLLESWLGRYTEVDITLDGRTERLGQLAKQVKDRAADLRTSLSTTYGVVSTSVDEGAVVLDFAEHFGGADDELL